MNGKVVLIGIGVTGLAAWFGYDKYKQYSKLKELTVVPGPKPFKFGNMSNGIANFTLGLLIKNPATVGVTVDKLGVDAYYAGNFIGRVLPQRVTLIANSTSPLNLPMQVVANKLLPFAQDLLTLKQIPVTFKVLAMVTVLGKQFTIPYELTMDVKEALQSYLRESKPLLAKLIG